MQFTNIIASALLVAGSLAAPPATKLSVASPSESWALAMNARDVVNNSPGELAARDDISNSPDELAAREYWAGWAFKLRDGAHALKRSILESQCEIAEAGIYCRYTHKDLVAFDDAAVKLQKGCVTVDTGVTCFYPGSFEELKDE